MMKLAYEVAEKNDIPHGFNIVSKMAGKRGAGNSCCDIQILKAIELAQKENVIMLCLPPHTTHKIQRLDRTPFKHLQTYYDQAAERWLRTHVGRVITPYQLCELVNEAYCKAATMSIAIHGFARCGIWPCSRDVFAESELHASLSNMRDQSTSFAETS